MFVCCVSFFGFLKMSSKGKDMQVTATWQKKRANEFPNEFPVCTWRHGANRHGKHAPSTVQRADGDGRYRRYLKKLGGGGRGV